MLTDKQLYGNYLGICVQNNDPEKRGRVKIFVPHIAAAVYTGWNEEFSDLTDKHFVFLDKDLNPDLDKILPYLKDVLPWAEIANPLFGGSASGRYNAFTGKGSTSDSNYWENNELQLGFRPVQNYLGENRVQDAFSETDGTHNSIVNPNANQYSPGDYSNLARGEFTIPNVGAHVWVFFTNGDPNYPVVFASSHGEEDWRRIYNLNKNTEEIEDFQSTDYPQSYENLSEKDKSGPVDHNVKTFRSKHVLNSNKHTVEFVDTDLAELLKFTHYSGSFLEFNNNTTTRFATNNDQTLVLGDQFLTVRKNQAIYIANYQETIIDGDRFLKLGDFTKRRELVKKILNIHRNTHINKRLFEIMRAESNAHNSPKQKQDGDFAKCPTCQGEGDKFDLPCVTCGGSGDSPSTQWGIWLDDDIKWEPDDLSVEVYQGRSDNPFTTKDYSEKIIHKIIRDNQKKITDLQYESQFGNGGDDIVLITGNRVTTIGTVLNDLEAYRVDPVGKIRNEGTHVGKTGSYLSMAQAPLIEYVDVDSLPGGDWDVTVSNKYRLTVGSKGVHIKTTGPLDMYGSIVNLYGEGMYISAQQELLIDGGKHLELKGDIINLKPREGIRGEVLTDGNHGVAGNLTVLGGTHVEGELHYLHATAPEQDYLTEVGFGPLAHTHVYKAPPWTLLKDCDLVRESAQAINQMKPMPNMKCYGVWIPN